MIGFAGLNSTPPPGLGGFGGGARGVGLPGLPNFTGALPGLPNNFAPQNGMALNQQAQAAPFQPAYSPPPQMPAMPDAQAQLAALQAAQPQQHAAAGGGITPNSSTPPAATAPATTAPPATAAPGAPPTWQDLLHSLSQGQVPGMPNMGGFANLGQNISNGLAGGIGNIGGDISGLMSRLFGGQPPNWAARFGGGSMPGTQPQDGGPGVPPPFAMQIPNQGGVLGGPSLNPAFANAPRGILNFGG